MIKIDHLLLSVLILVCLVISIVIVDLATESALIPSIVYAQDEELTVPFSDQEPFLEYQMNQNQNQIDWETYRNEGYAFEVQFPKSLQKKAIPNQNALNSGIGVPPQAPIWEFRLQDQTLYQGTNLQEAALIIHVIHKDEYISRCLSPKPGSRIDRNQDALPVVDINGAEFVRERIQEGVMGGMYEQISYRTLYQGACYEITQLIKTVNLEFFPEGQLQLYDRTRVLQRLDGVLNTFRLLDIEPTFPEQSYPVPKTFDQAVEKSGTDSVDGLDVSHWQGEIKWAKVGEAGYEFSFVKGTEGVGWTDSKFIDNMENGPNSGVVRGVYHFARPDLGNTGQEEADYFLSVAGDYLESGHLRPVLDLEVRGSMGKTALSNWVLEWAQTVENQTGVPPLIYTNLFYINNYLTSAVTEYDLWIAYWTCDPTVTFDIPPTGKWADWAFWQYSAPSLCTDNYVPGVEYVVDKNIFNGVSAGLQEYDAASPLWVSLFSDAYIAPAPYFADLTANVNGDAVGTIDFAFWWDCTALDADIESVEAACGALPDPPDGDCEQNELGWRCAAVDNEIQLLEHTYQEIGDYTAKVIVERGSAPPAEDRYKITVINPIISVDPQPPSPGSGPVYSDYQLQVDVSVSTSVAGALQVEVINQDSQNLLDSSCQALGSDVTDLISFQLGLSEQHTGLSPYDIAARYRAGGDCPVADIESDDVMVGYQITWIEPLFDRIGLYDPDSSIWYLKPVNDGGWDGVNSFKYGPEAGGRQPISGDWTGDGKDIIGQYDPVESIFYLKSENITGWDGVNIFKFGPANGGRVPVRGDWDGDGIDTIGLYDPLTSIWYLKPENTGGWDGVNFFKYGPAGEGRIPIVGDWDGDGIDTIGLFDQATSIWYLKTENVTGWDGVEVFKFGPSEGGRIPVIGDWDNSGRDRIGLYDPATGIWYLKDENSGGWNSVNIFKFGPEDSTRDPIAGRW